MSLLSIKSPKQNSMDIDKINTHLPKKSFEFQELSVLCFSFTSIYNLDDGDFSSEITARTFGILLPVNFSFSMPT